MPKDKDRDLIDKMNRALTEEIQVALEKVLAEQLKPINIKLIAIENKLKKVEERIYSLEREQKKQGSMLKNLQKTLNIAIKTFDIEDVRLYKRLKRIETHLELPEVL